MGFRAWLAFAGIGSTAAFAYRGDWLAACTIAVVVLVSVAWRVRGALLATRAAMCGETATGRHRRRGQPRELKQVPQLP